jgi:hypothetical protein
MGDIQPIRRSPSGPVQEKFVELSKSITVAINAAANTTTQSTQSVPGIKPGDMLLISASTLPSGITISADTPNVADSVNFRIGNLTGAPIVVNNITISILAFRT